MNIRGQIITNSNEKNNVSLNHIKYRMRKRWVKDEFKEIEELDNNLFEKLNKKSRQNKIFPFQMKELDIVLIILKPGKAKIQINMLLNCLKVVPWQVT